MAFIELYFAYLAGAFAYDASVFTNWVMYAPVLIPIFFYTIFFIFKWWILLMPVWVPARILLNLSMVPLYRLRHNSHKFSDKNE